MTAAVLLPLALIVLWKGGNALLLLTLFVYLLLNYECLTMTVPLKVLWRLLFLCSILILPFSLMTFEKVGLLGGVLCAQMLIFVLSLILADRGYSLEQLSQVLPGALLTLFYTGLLGSVIMLIALRPNGHLSLLWLLLVVMATDSAAYFGGKLIGGPLLAQKISPKKTISGAIMGLLAGILLAIGGAYFLQAKGNLLIFAAYGLIVALLCELGDLVESLLKRIYGVKDSGVLLPGHGGFLDRLDGFIFASPLLLFIDFFPGH